MVGETVRPWKGAGLRRMHVPLGNSFAQPVNNAGLALRERVLGVLANPLKCTFTIPVQITGRGFE